MIYECNKCKARFDEPDYEEEQESFEFWGSVGRHTFVVEICPECGSENFEEAEEELDDE